MSENTLSPEMTLALSKQLESLAKDMRDAVGPGEYEFEHHVSLVVKGKMTVDEDTMATPSNKIPWKTALALFMRYAGITGDHAQKALIKAMKEAADIEKLPDKAKKKKASEILRESTDLNEAEEKVQDALKTLKKVPRRGAVRPKVSVGVLGVKSIWMDEDSAKSSTG